MSVFDLDERESLSALSTQGVRLDQVEPVFGYRTAYGFGMGVMKGGARVAQAVGLAGAAIPIAFDKVAGGTRAQDAYFGTYDDVMQNAADYWTPRAEEVGTAGKLLGGLAEMALPLMAGAGNPALLLAGQGLGMGVDLAREGVNPYSAAAVGTVQAAATAGGFAIPFLGRNLLQRVGMGAAGNLATNIPADFVSQEVLRAAGATEQAKRFDPFSLEARTLDIVAGGAFGAVGHLLARGSITEDDARAAWASARNAKNFQEDSAPRPLETPEQSIAHQTAMETALQQFARGEPIRVPPSVADGIDGVTQAPRPEMVAALREVMAEQGPPLPDETPRAIDTAAQPDPVAAAVQDLTGQSLDAVLQAPGVRALRALVGVDPDAPPMAARVADTPAPEASKGLAAQLPELDAARAVVTRLPDTAVKLEDGTEVRASDLLARVEADVRQAEVEAKTFSAAVQCFLEG